MSCKSRKETYSIMNGGGFGELVITKKGKKVTVPNECITTDGLIRSDVQACIKGLSDNDIKRLESFGVIIEQDAM